MEYRPLQPLRSHPILDLEGVWTLRFGAFGCLESDMLGGIVHVQGDRLIGGDSYFVYAGCTEAVGTELTGWLEIRRHRDAPSSACLWENTETVYRLRFVAEALSADRIEGRLTRPGFPDKHLSMCRLLTMPCSVTDSGA